MRAHLLSTARRAFTLVELMIVVVVVAILAMIAVSNYADHVKASRMTEGITGAGVIRHAFQTYASSHGGAYPVLAGVDGSGLDVLHIDTNDLAGRYFTPDAYLVTSTNNTYTVRATLPEDGNYWYEVDEDGDATQNSF